MLRFVNLREGRLSYRDLGIGERSQMPSYYLHLMLSYQRAAEAGIAEAHCPAFLLGAVAPDAVVVHRDKLRTHYTVYAGITWGYRFSAFEREFAGYREQSALHQYFYRGYKYHLFLDDAWMRECLHRALLRLMIGRLTRDAHVRVQYYGEMSQFDAFYRSSVGTAALQDACACLAQADLDLLPEFLERGVVGSILEHLSDAMLKTTSYFDGQILRPRNVERFLLRVSKLPIALQL